MRAFFFSVKMKKLIILLIITFLTSCSLFSKREKWIDKDLINPIKKDYEEHLVKLGQNYIDSPGIKVVKLSRHSNRYLKSLYKRMVNDNELLFDETFNPKFYIIKSRTPFYFSLPKAHFYLSLGLVKKFIKNEEMLAAVLSAEIIKSLRSVYKKQKVVPIGYMRTERMLSLVRIPFDTKNKINKWAYFILRRSGYDPSVYLTWLQLQNRNTLEFSLQYGNVQTISREEFQFKNFVSQNRENNERFLSKKTSSSLAFYKMINEIKRIGR